MASVVTQCLRKFARLSIPAFVAYILDIVCTKNSFASVSYGGIFCIEINQNKLYQVVKDK